MANVDRLSTLDDGYVTGDLSLFPVGLDDKTSLYQARNNAETALTQGLSYSGKFIVVDDATGFPPNGLIRVGTELVYYDSRTANTFKDLKRGFAQSRQSLWPIATKVTNSVMAEHHNAIKDALINIQKNLGLEENPDALSLNGLLKSLEVRFLAPKPLFSGFPRKGSVPLTVCFQNFSTGEGVRYFWDFGDGSTSQDVSPVHTYMSDGVYTVQMSTFTAQKAQGVVTKKGYVTVDAVEKLSYVFVEPTSGPAGTFVFVDQTDGDIASRHWVFGDGTDPVTVTDPYIHTVSHAYTTPGNYTALLLVVFASGKQRTLTVTVTVTD